VIEGTPVLAIRLKGFSFGDTETYLKKNTTRLYLTQYINEIVSLKSIHPQNRRLIFDYSLL